MTWQDDIDADDIDEIDMDEWAHDPLSELPDHYETLLTAKYFDDASIEQIARVEEATPVAVRSKLARARRAFRDVFTRLAEGSGNSRMRENHES